MDGEFSSDSVQSISQSSDGRKIPEASAAINHIITLLNPNQVGFSCFPFFLDSFSALFGCRENV